MKQNNNKLPRANSTKNPKRTKYSTPYVNGSLKGNNKYPSIISTYNESRSNYNPNSTFIPKIEEENLYKINISLKEDMNKLKEDYTFLKANNHRLTLLLGKKEKEIDELTTEIINLRNEVEKLNMKKDNNKNINRVKSGKKNNKKNEEKEEKKSEEKFEKTEEKIEKSSFFSKMKVQYNNLNKLLKEKEDEIFKLKKNTILTKANEEKIQSEILLKELNKIKNLYDNISSINYSKSDLDIQNRIMKTEIENQHGIIVQLNTNLNTLKNDKKKLEKELNFLKEKCKSNQNSSKMLSNENKKLQDQMQIILKNEVEKEDWITEKKELNKKIEVLQKDLDHYRLLVVQLKDYNPKNKNNQNQDDKSVLNESNISLFRVVSKNNKMENPEEKENTQILLLQSIIKELTKDKNDLEEKIKFLENQLYTQSNFKSGFNQTIISKKDITNSKILIDDNSKTNDINQLKNTTSEIKEYSLINEKINDNKTGTLPLMSDLLKSEIPKLDKFNINFEDIILINFESKNMNKENAKNLFSMVFSQFNDADLDNDDDYKDQIISSLSNVISINLNCNDNEKEKKEIEKYLSDLYDEDDNSEFKNNFYDKFNNIPDHNELKTIKSDEEFTKILNFKLFPNKNTINNLIESFPNKINLMTLNDIFYKNNIFLSKNEFMFLCYKLKTDECKSLYDIDIKRINIFTKEPENEIEKEKSQDSNKSEKEKSQDSNKSGKEKSQDSNEFGVDKYNDENNE